MLRLIALLWKQMKQITDHRYKFKTMECRGIDNIQGDQEIHLLVALFDRLMRLVDTNPYTCHMK